MIKFLNLETGYSFDGLWTENQEKGYIFWFPKEQSINLTYTMPIAFVTSSSTPIALSIEANNIFSFICSTENSITDVTYSNEYITVPEKIGNNKYVHVFNIVCSSNNVGEYICKINIGNKGYIRVGADFYGEHEPIYVMLSNMGIELPVAIQKAIYDSNVHEDLQDNILINRKFKELMSNYWDIIANKGSYKSLLNALEWFEWNDQLKIKEIYKYKKADKIFFCDKELISEVTSSVEKYIDDFAKTTYIALYCSLQDELPSYDNEYNPELVQATFKWCTNDIKLKIALFAKFFGLHFLPIHISIFNATAEDTVFTNTIKSIHNGFSSRHDYIGSFNYVQSNIKNDDIFSISNIRAQVSPKTVFGILNTNEFFGVDEFPSQDIILQKSNFNYYTGPGAIIPIELVLSNINQKDFIKETIIEYTDDLNNWKQLKFNTIFKPENNEIKIFFNFLAKSIKKYILHFTFILGSSKTLSKKLIFNVEDLDNVNINIYKVQAKDDSKCFYYNDFLDISNYRYFFKIQNNLETVNDNSLMLNELKASVNSNNLYLSGNNIFVKDNILYINPYYFNQYLPYLQNYDSSYKGIKMNHTVVIKINHSINTDLFSELTDILSEQIQLLSNKYGYLSFIKYGMHSNDKKIIKYVTLVSNKFIQKIDKEHLNKLIEEFITNITKKYDGINLSLIRSDLGFYPQFHNLVKIEGNNIEDYTVKPYEALCCAAEIVKDNEIIPFRYGHMINSFEWIFTNNTTGKQVLIPMSSQKPFVATDETKILSNGYYDVSFKYSLSNGLFNEYKLNSAFRIKN